MKNINTTSNKNNNMNEYKIGSNFERNMDEKERHDTGATYTPEIIAIKNSEYTICKYISNGQGENIKEVIELYKENPEKLINKLNNLKIVDPACGTGNFLTGVIKILQELYKNIYNKKYDEIKIKQQIINNNIYGVDLNPEAIKIAQRIIPTKHIKTGNSIITKKFNWEKEFPEVFEQGGFDIVIGNPPYVSNNTLCQEYPETVKTLNKSKEYTTLTGKWDLSVTFFEKGLKLLKPNGILCYINTRTYTEKAYGKKLRAMLLKNTILKYNDHTGEKLFNATVDTCSIFVQKAKPSENHKINIDNKLKVKQSKITDEGFFFDEKTIKLQQIPIRCNTNKLEEICYISVGMALHANPKYRGEFVKADLISKTKDQIHTHEYVEGKNIEEYNIKEIRYLEYNSERVPNKIASKTFPELYEAQEKILINKLGIIKAVNDTNQLVCDQTIRVAVRWTNLKGINNNSIRNQNREKLEKISEEYNPKYITAIINSPVGKMLLDRIRSTKNMDINPSYLKQIPVAKANTTTQNKIAEQVDIMMDKEASNNAKTNAETIINKTIYEIYELTEEEIAIINDNY